jgi:hypothetical protein
VRNENPPCKARVKSLLFFAVERGCRVKHRTSPAFSYTMKTHVISPVVIGCDTHAAIQIRWPLGEAQWPRLCVPPLHLHPHVQCDNEPHPAYSLAPAGGGRVRVGRAAVSPARGQLDACHSPPGLPTPAARFLSSHLRAQ